MSYFRRFPPNVRGRPTPRTKPQQLLGLFYAKNVLAKAQSNPCNPWLTIPLFPLENSYPLYHVDERRHLLKLFMKNVSDFLMIFRLVKIKVLLTPKISGDPSLPRDDEPEGACNSWLMTCLHFRGLLEMLFANCTYCTRSFSPSKLPKKEIGVFQRWSFFNE